MPEATNKLAKLLDEQISKSEGAEEIERLMALRQQAIAQDALTDPLQAMEQRMASTRDPRELVLLTSVRGEIIRQNETATANNHKRYLEKAELVSKYTLSVLALFIGALLVYSGVTWAGLLIVGAGLYNIAPKYVMTALRAYVKGDKDDQGL